MEKVQKVQHTIDNNLYGYPLQISFWIDRSYFVYWVLHIFCPYILWAVLTLVNGT